MDKIKIDDAGKRYKEISDIVANDFQGDRFLSKVVGSAGNYVEVVSNLESKSKISESIDPRQTESMPSFYFRHSNRVKESLDKERRYAHNALISNLNICNRYLFNNYENVPEGGIFSLNSGDINNRDAVGDWAGYLIFALKKMEREDLNK